MSINQQAFTESFQCKVLSMKDTDFNALALEAFHFQAKYNPIYTQYLQNLNFDTSKVSQWEEIPCLPISFFKQHRVQCKSLQPKIVFESSGTTGQTNSKHYLSNTNFYQQLAKQIFEQFYGPIKNYHLLALLPSYLERKSASLVYMVDSLMKEAGKESGFYLHDLTELARKMIYLREKGEPVLLIGVTFALLDLADRGPFDFSHAIVMETGGMKGRRKEMLREELHQRLCQQFNITEVHSEYGMTEMISQGYSKGQGVFQLPPSLKVQLREVNDPFARSLKLGKTGGINIFDLGNIETCCFLETQDLGRILPDGFEVLGRFDNSDIRGCNLMVA